MTYSTIFPQSSSSCKNLSGRMVPRVGKANISSDSTTLISLSWKSKEEEPESLSLKQKLLPCVHVVLLILWWYVLGSASNNVSKVLLHKFPFPLTLSLAQNLAPVLSFCWITMHQQVRSRQEQQSPSDANTPSKTSNLSLSSFLAYWRWGILLGLCSICGGVLHRVSLLYMHVSFVHTIKATQPLFAAAISYFWLNESLPTMAYISLIPIVSGVCLAAFSEIDTNVIGLSSCLISTFVLCLSNVACKKMMLETSLSSKDHPPFTKDSVFYFTALYALPMMLILWLVLDLPQLMQGLSSLSATSSQFQTVICLLIVNAVLNSLQNYTSLCVLSHVTSVSHAVATTFKRIFIIVVAIGYFHNQVSAINVLGVVISSLGVGMYQLTKHKAKRSNLPLSPSIQTDLSCSV